MDEDNKDGCQETFVIIFSLILLGLDLAALYKGYHSTKFTLTLIFGMLILILLVKPK